MLVRALALSTLSALATAQNIGPNFINDFNYVPLPDPTVPLSWGGAIFKPGNPNVLLMGGHAYNSTGEIWEVPLVRGAGGHITGLAGGDALLASAPYIDGGLTFAPGNVLLFTSWPNNDLGQLKPGSTVSDRTDNLGAFGVLSSTGGACIVPVGFAGAGRLKLTSYTADTWHDMALTPDGNGTFAPGNVTNTVSLPGTGYGGPEGIAYVHGGGAGIAVDSVAIAEYGEWQVALYDIDANGDPMPATRQVLLDNIVNADGLVFDTLTGDFVVVGQGGELGLIQRVSAPPFTYCTPGTSTNGCLASMSFSGTPSASQSSGFTLICNNMEGQKQGIQFYGISGPNNSPWGSGSTSFLCVKPPTQRMLNLNSGGTINSCNGSVSTDFLAFIAANAGAVGAPLASGQVVNAQTWYRDPPAPKTTSLSDALEFTVVP